LTASRTCRTSASRRRLRSGFAVRNTFQHPRARTRARVLNLWNLGLDRRC
jgi:hypothetical protein